MPFASLFVSPDQPLLFLAGEYSFSLVALSVAVAVATCVMAMHLAGLARGETRAAARQAFLASGAFTLGTGIWGMHFIGMLAFSACSSAHYDLDITLASMVPGFLASWVALATLARDRVAPWLFVPGALSMGGGIGAMHYSGMMAIHQSLVLRFDPAMFAVSVVVTILLSALGLWVRFGLSGHERLSPARVNIASGMVLAVAISAMHYTGMAAARFLASDVPGPVPESNTHLAVFIAAITILASAITGGLTMLLRYRALYQRVVHDEARLRTIVDTAVDGIIIIDSRGLITAFNPAAETIFGWRAEEVAGRNVAMLMPEPDHSRHNGYLRRRQLDGAASIVGIGREVVGQRKDGSTFPLRLAIGKADWGSEPMFVGFITDISQRKRMEQALRTSEQQYRSLIGNLPGVAFRCRADSDWTMLFVSDAVERLTGWSAEDFTSGRITFAQVIHEDDRARVAHAVAEALAAARPYMIDYRIHDRAGCQHWVAESASGAFGDDGTVQWIDGIIIDVSDQKCRNAEFEGVVAAISHSLAVVEFALDGTILDANAIFQSLTGYGLTELVGRHHSMLCLPDEAGSPSYRAMWEALRQGRHTAGEFHRIGKDGRDIWIHGSYNPILDPQGRPTKIIKFASDLSQRHAMEQNLREAKARAEHASAAKGTFLANMSHEIRTPMNAIIGFTEVLLGEPVTDTQRRHLTTVRDSARSLMLLLNDILDTAKLERGAVELEIRDFSLREVCIQVLASLRVNAQGKGLALLLDYPDAEPEFFQGDSLRLQQILLNLVGNAIKFTERGEVRITCRRRDGMVRLVVADTGIGIAADRVDHIFDAFAQADASMTRRFGGTGLGTTIARQLVELMGGHIWVDSQIGVGSRFHVDLPLADGRPVALVQDRAAIALPALDILVADDVPQNLELLSVTLGRLGHTLTTATNGEEAVRAFAQGRFDIVLMDVQMPVMNGLDAARAIRRLEMERDVPPTPIVALTASVLEEDVRASRDSGMDGFAAKPVDLHALSVEIARLLGIAVDDTPPPAAPLALVHGSVIDWAQGQRLWGSQPRHRQAIVKFLADFAGIVAEMRARPDACRPQAHRLKGAAGNLALSRVTSLAGAIEQDGASDEILDRLAGELGQVADAVGQVADEQGDDQPALALDPIRLRAALDRLDDSLSHGELDEDALAAIAAMVERPRRENLAQAIDSFDFDAARQVVATLRDHYAKDTRP